MNLTTIIILGLILIMLGVFLVLVDRKKDWNKNIVKFLHTGIVSSLGLPIESTENLWTYLKSSLLGFILLLIIGLVILGQQLI